MRRMASSFHALPAGLGLDEEKQGPSVPASVMQGTFVYQEAPHRASSSAMERMCFVLQAQVAPCLRGKGCRFQLNQARQTGLLTTPSQVEKKTRL